VSAGQGVGAELEVTPPAPSDDAAARPFAIPAWRACQLLLELRWTRTRARWFGGTTPSSPRSSTSRWPLVLSVLVALAALSLMGLGYGLFFRLIAQEGAGVAAKGGALLSLFCAVAWLMNFSSGNKDLNQLDADMEWLLTLPISITTLRLVRVLERSLLAVPSWLLVYPSVVGALSLGQYSLGVFPLALVLSVPLFLMIALTYAVTEDVLRLYGSKLVINTVQIAGTIAGILGMMGISRMLTRLDIVAPVLGLAWLPTTQIAALAAARQASPLSALGHGVLLLASSATALALGLYWLARVAQRGPVVGAGARSGERGHARLVQRVSAGGFTRVVFSNELKRVLRDRNSFIVALLIPALLCVGTLPALFIKLGADELFGSPRHLPALAFAVAALSLLQSTLLLFALDGKAMWLVYSVPRSLMAVVWRKGAFWLLLALAFVAGFVLVGLRYQPPSLALAGSLAYVVVALTLLALIGSCFSLYCVDPTSTAPEDGSQRGLPWQLLIMLLVCMAGVGLYFAPVQQAVTLGLLAAVALGAWQDAERQIPFFLEPDLAPPPSIRLSDGLVAAFVFGNLQAVFRPLLQRHFGLESWPALVLGFALSGTLVGAGAVYLLQRRGLPALYDTLGVSWGGGARASVKWGLSGALPAVALAGVAVLVIQHAPALKSAGAELAAQRGIVHSTGLPSILLLHVLIAPLCEELIFRGLVYKGLRATLSPARSVVLGSLVFALVHPATAFVPVFLMACCAALAFERSRSLLSPIIVHAAYNLTLFIAGALMS
jgi:ABC-2 type transport system permease protein